MGRPCLAATLVVLALATSPPAAGAGQPEARGAAASGVPPTPWGDPDLQGTWTNTTTTPLQRPPELAGRERFTLEERAELDAARARTEVRACATELVVLQHAPPPTSTGSYNSFWLEQGTRTLQTSLIVDPPDGRLPAVTPRAQRRADALAATRAAASYPATWDEPSVFERCITRGLPATMMPGFYNHNYQILQTPDYVVIQAEMLHDARIVPLDGRPHLPAGVRQWLGDSRGRWEGETLVVETTNFTDKVYERRVSNTVFGAGGGDAPRGAVHPPRRRHARLPLHRQRPDDVRAALDRGDPDDGARRAHSRVRLPRGQLFDGEHAARRPRPGAVGARRRRRRPRRARSRRAAASAASAAGRTCA